MNKEEEKYLELAIQLRRKLMSEYKDFFNKNKKKLNESMEMLLGINMSVYSSILAELIDQALLKSNSIELKLEFIDNFCSIVKKTVIEAHACRNKLN